MMRLVRGWNTCHGLSFHARACLGVQYSDEYTATNTSASAFQPAPTSHDPNRNDLLPAANDAGAVPFAVPTDTPFRYSAFPAAVLLDVNTSDVFVELKIDETPTLVSVCPNTNALLLATLPIWKNTDVPVFDPK